MAEKTCMKYEEHFDGKKKKAFKDFNMLESVAVKNALFFMHSETWNSSYTLEQLIMQLCLNHLINYLWVF